jgi:hypothetical protein
MGLKQSGVVGSGEKNPALQVIDGGVKTRSAAWKLRNQTPGGLIVQHDP